MPAIPTDPQLADLNQAYAQALATYGGKPDVTGVDIGYAYDGDTRLETFAVRVHTMDGSFGGDVPASALLAEAAAHALAPAPSHIGGVPLIFLKGNYRRYRRGASAPRRSASAPTPGISSLMAGVTPPEPAAVPTQQYVSPVQPGVNIAADGYTGGTLGLIVFDDAGTAYVLSCAHVLAPGGHPPKCSIIQPERLYSDLTHNEIGTLSKSIDDRDGDAATATWDPRYRTYNRPVFLTGANVQSSGTATIGARVEKCGSTTQTTCGLVDGIGRYFLDGGAGMDGFRVVSDPSLGACSNDVSDYGDSGAVWYRKSDSVGLGILTAGDLSVDDPKKQPAVASNLPTVLTRLGVRLDAPRSAG